VQKQKRYWKFPPASIFAWIKSMKHTVYRNFCNENVTHCVVCVFTLIIKIQPCFGPPGFLKHAESVLILMDWFCYLAVSFHSISPSLLTMSSSNSEKSGWAVWFDSSVSSRKNWTRWAVAWGTGRKKEDCHTSNIGHLAIFSQSQYTWDFDSLYYICCYINCDNSTAVFMHYFCIAAPFIII